MKATTEEYKLTKRTANKQSGSQMGRILTSPRLGRRVFRPRFELCWTEASPSHRQILEVQ